MPTYVIVDTQVSFCKSFNSFLWVPIIFNTVLRGLRGHKHNFFLHSFTGIKAYIFVNISSDQSRPYPTKSFQHSLSLLFNFTKGASVSRGHYTGLSACVYTYAGCQEALSYQHSLWRCHPLHTHTFLHMSR